MRGQKMGTLQQDPRLRFRGPAARTWAVVAAALLLPSIAFAQMTLQLTDLSMASATLHSGSYFGLKMAMNSSLMAISAPYEAVDGVEAAGVVYVFHTDGTMWYKLANPNPTRHSYFGLGLAMDEDKILVGASHAHHTFSYSGVVYMYDTAGVPIGDPFANPGTKPFFGREIEIGADGSFYISAIGSTGEVYRFAEPTGSLTSAGAHTVGGLAVTPFPNPDPSNHPIYGTSLAVNPIGELFVSGQKFFATGGVIHRFDNTNSYQSSIPVSGTIGLVLKADETGRVYAGTVESSSTGMHGSVRVYDLADQLEMVIPGPAADDNFAASLAIMGDKLVVGAPTQAVDGVAEAGSAYVYDRATGTLLSTLSWPETPASPRRFGQEVEAWGETLMVAAPLADTSQGEDAGEVVTFTNQLRYCGRLIEDFDHVFTGSDGNDVIIGTAGDDLILLGAGDDEARGRKGDDCLVGGPGNDRLYGGKGHDTQDGGEGWDKCRKGEVLEGCEY